jgi:hypothetical protein
VKCGICGAEVQSVESHLAAMTQRRTLHGATWRLTPRTITTAADSSEPLVADDFDDDRESLS